MRVSLRGAVSSVTADSPGTTGLVSWWGLGESSGTRVDSHGSQDLDGVTGTGAPSQVAGVVGNAVSWNTITNKAMFHNGNGIDVSAFTAGITVGGWVKQSAGTLTVAFLGVLAQTNPTGDHRSFDLWSRYFSVSTDGSANIVTDSVTASSGWAFVVGVWNRAVGRMEFWKNGVLEKFNNSAPTTALYHTAGSNNRTAIFGTSAGFSNGGGDLDEVFLYNRPLSEAEILWLYNGGAGRSYADL